MNATVTPHEYAQAKGWDLMSIAVSADDLPDEDAQNVDKYVEGGAMRYGPTASGICEKSSCTGLIRLQRHASSAICGLCAVTLPGRFEGFGDTLPL